MQKKIIGTLLKVLIFNTFVPLLFLITSLVGISKPEKVFTFSVLALCLVNIYYIGKYAKYLPKMNLIDYFFGEDK